VPQRRETNLWKKIVAVCREADGEAAAGYRTGRRTEYIFGYGTIASGRKHSMTSAQLLSILVFMVAFVFPMFLIFFFALIWPVMRKKEAAGDAEDAGSQPAAS
jgi:hypothetical protein